MRAVIYVRVSTTEQVTNFSLDTQETACRAYCKQKGWRVVRVFRDEGESAKSTARPQFQEMLGFCHENRKTVDVVVVYALSRFSRSSLDHHVVRAKLAKDGITLRSATEPIDESPMGRLMENVGSAFAEFDNSMRAERTVVGMRAKLEAGGWPFQAPLGYDQPGGGRGSTLVHDPERAPLVRQAFELLASGVHTARSALEVVNRLGLRTRRGKPVPFQTFHRMLRNPVYCGRLEVKDWSASHRGAFEPIVSEELFMRVQAILQGKKPSLTAYDRNNPEFPLRRFVRCGRCDTPLTASFTTGRNRTRHAYYHCRKKGCGGTTVRRDVLEEKFLKLIAAIRPRAEYLKLFRAVVIDVWRERQAEAEQLSRAAEKKLAELKDRQAALVDAFVYRQAITKTVYEDELARLEEAIIVAQIEANEAQIESLDLETVLGFAEYVITHAERLWIEFDLDKKQRLQRVLFPEGLKYTEGEFEAISNRVTGSIFTHLRLVEGGNEELASPTGFEPVLPP